MLFEFDFADDLIDEPKDRFGAIERNQDYLPEFKTINDLEKNDENPISSIKKTINLINFLYLSLRFQDCLTLCLTALNLDDSEESYGLQQKPTSHGKASNGNIRTIIDSAVRCAIKLQDNFTLVFLWKEASKQEGFDFGFWVTRIILLKKLGHQQECFTECISYLKKRPHDIPVLKILISLPLSKTVIEILSKFYKLNVPLSNVPVATETFEISEKDLKDILRHEVILELSVKDL